MKTILVGYDDKEPAKRALSHAIEEAKRTGARLVVLVVAETPLPPTGLQNFGTLDDSPPVLEPLEPTSEVEAALERARDTVEAAGLEADLAWSVGDPSAEIVATARDQHADQVVLGEHHHSALGRFFGSDVAGDVEKELGSELVVLE